MQCYRTATLMAAAHSNPSVSPERGRVAFMDGRGDLPMLEVVTRWSTAGIYLHGAHVTHFKKHDEPHLLFLSQCSRFASNEPIRGGVPVIFPWFGPKEGLGQHGFARTKDWELKEFASAPDGSVTVRLRLPDSPEAKRLPKHSVEFVVTVNEKLTMEFAVENQSSETLSFEDCLHTYFEVGDINSVSVIGLKGTKYLDKVENFAEKTEANDAIRISSEVDRVYLETTSTVEIRDENLKRRITVTKEGSRSTVVWNPWIAKAQALPDFGNDEYQRMICVESGNVGGHAVQLAAGKKHSLKVIVGSGTL
jgi:glucose-6-phosphate 1-epimerase